MALLPGVPPGRQARQAGERREARSKGEKPGLLKPDNLNVNNKHHQGALLSLWARRTPHMLLEHLVVAWSPTERGDRGFPIKLLIPQRETHDAGLVDPSR